MKRAAYILVGAWCLVMDGGTEDIALLLGVAWLISFIPARPEYR